MKSISKDELRIGWIGTGVMGKWMCSHLIAQGYSMHVHNRTRSKAEELLEKHAVWHDTPAAVAENSDIIFTIIGHPKDVQEVYLGKKGLLGSAKEGTIFVDMTTTSPTLAVKIAEEAAQRGCSFLDAPVSGGDVGAREARLAIMVGGDEKTFEVILPLFKLMGKNIILEGPAGSGQHTKMCNQITIAGTMIGVSEALLYGAKAGLELEKMVSTISKGAAGCWTLDNLAPRVIQRDYRPGFFVDHFIKDMKIALEEAERMQLSLPGLALVYQLYLGVQSSGDGKDGTQALIKAIERISRGETFC